MKNKNSYLFVLFSLAILVSQPVFSRNNEREKAIREIESFGFAFDGHIFLEAVGRDADDLAGLFIRGGILENEGLFAHALARAVSADNMAIIRVLFEHARPEHFTAGWDSVLVEAAGRGNLELVRLLIDHGADPEAERKTESMWSNYVETPLMAAAINGKTEVVSFLLDYGAEADTQGVYGETALIKTAIGGHIMYMRIEPELNSGTTRTHAFGQYGSDEAHEEIVRILLQTGADVNVEDIAERTPLFWAANRGNRRIVELLVEAGAKLNGRDLGDASVLDALVGGGFLSSEQKETANFLIDAGVDYQDLDPMNAAVLNLLIVVRENLERGIDLDYTDEMGNTMLHWAAANGSDQVVDFLLRNGATSDLTNRDGMTPVMYAIAYGWRDLVRTLESAGARVNRELYNEVLQRYYSVSVSRDGLFRAAENGLLEVMKILLELDLDINYQDDWSGFTPLMAAAGEGSPELVEYMLDRGADAETLDRDGRSALDYAMRNGHDHLTEILSSHGAILHDTENPGIKSKPETGFNYIAQGDVESLLLLLEEGLNVNSVDPMGTTLLMASAGYGRKDIAEILIRRGANINKCNQNGMNAYDIAILEWKTDIARLLIKSGFNTDTERFKRELAARRIEFTPDSFVEAVEAGDIETVELFLKAGMDIDAPGAKYSPYFFPMKRPAVMVAFMEGNEQMVGFLLESGADINAEDEEGKTLLFEAVKDDDVSGARQLLELGADPNIPMIDEYGDRQEVYPLFEAVDYEYWDMASLLLENGAVVDNTNPAGMDIFIYIIGSGNLSLIESAVENGADPGNSFHREMGVDIPFIALALTTGNVKASGYLLSRGADPGINAGDLELDPPFILALRMDEFTLAEQLLEAGINLNDKDSRGNTALMTAAEFGQSELVLKLLEAGADISARNREGISALDLAEKGGYGDIVDLLTSR